MEGEHFTRPGLEVAAVGKASDLARCFINEGEGFRVIDPLQLCGGVSTRLLFYRGDFFAPSIRLRFDDPERFAVCEQRIVGRANRCLILANRNSLCRGMINCCSWLHSPT